MKDIELNDMLEVLYESIDLLLDSYDLDISNSAVYKMRYYLKRTFFGLISFAETMRISCSGYDMPVYLYHRKYRDIKTSIFFTDPRELDCLVVLFAQKAGKHISLSNPIVDATLSDGSRIQLTYSTVVSTRGPSFTIRKFRKNPFLPIDLLVNKTFTIDEIISGWRSSITTPFWSHYVLPLSPLFHRGTECRFRRVLSGIAAMRQKYILLGEVRGVEAQTLATNHTTLMFGNGDSEPSAGCTQRHKRNSRYISAHDRHRFVSGKYV